MAQNVQNEVVITGISGRFPDCDSVQELKEKLYGGIDVVKEIDKYFNWAVAQVPRRSGILKDLSKFDAEFFKISGKQAKVMDPQLRILQEVVFEALIDSGYNPNELRGSRTGVFISNNSNDALTYFEKDLENLPPYYFYGTTRSMLGNRVSFSFDFKGPSYTVDAACASSLITLSLAFQAIRSGECDNAIVAGCQLLYNPAHTRHFNLMGTLNQDGKCKSFDASADGYVRSEAVNALFLQKKSSARRIYANVLWSANNADGYKIEGLTYPRGDIQEKLMRESLANAGLDPLKVSYVEAHGTGTKVGDPQEANAICNVFCPNRKTPLLIGSHKSNIGHTEACSGICGIIKVIFTMETGILPKNKNFKVPNPNIPGLIDGRLKVATENTPWDGEYVYCCASGLGGSNSQALLGSNKLRKSMTIESDLPKLVAVSGRTQQAVENFIKNIPNDDNFIGLVREIFSTNIDGHNFRGYAILNKDKTVEINIDVDEVDSTERPIWYVFPGAGSQWTGMAQELMKIPVFEESIKHSAKTLEKVGYDLIKVFYSNSPEVAENIFNSIITINAIQIAMIDVLKYLEIEPDGIFGHSVGETACAYADGAITHEECILLAYWRRTSIKEAKISGGLMASIGLSWEEVEKRIPKSISIACNNSLNNVTISGPEKDVETFMREIEAEKIFVRKVPSSGIAMHSPHLKPAYALFREQLELLLTNPRPRTSRWISSTIRDQDDPLAKTASPEYFFKNFTEPVFFYDCYKYIPDNAIIIELGPHCLFQSILKRALPRTCTLTSLSRRSEPNQVEYFLKNIGKIYNSGSKKIPQIKKLYPKISYPVPRNTPQISPLVEWDHSTNWLVPDFSENESAIKSVIEVDVNKVQDQFFTSHRIDGRPVLAAAGYMFFAWKLYAKMFNKSTDEFPIIMENVKFTRLTIIPSTGSLKFSLSFLNQSGQFELFEGENLVCTGTFLKEVGDISEKLSKLTLVAPQSNQIELKTEEIYKHFRMAGVEFLDLFQGVIKSDVNGERGLIKWNRNWVTMIDTLLQFSYLPWNKRELRLPFRVKRFMIDPIMHLKIAETAEELVVNNYNNINTVKCGGLELLGMEFVQGSRRKIANVPILENYTFIPYIDTKNEHDVSDVYSNLVQIVLENSSGIKIKVAEISSDPNSLLSTNVTKAIEVEPLWTADFEIFSNAPPPSENTIPFKTTFVNEDITKSEYDETFGLLLGKELALNTNLLKAVKPKGFVLIENKNLQVNEEDLKKIGLSVIAIQRTNEKYYTLLRKIKEYQSEEVTEIKEDLSWLPSLQKAFERSINDGCRIIIHSNDEHSGIIGLAKCIRKEPGGENLSCFFLDDSSAPAFSSSKYSKQLYKNLSINVFKNGVWGSYRLLLLKSMMENERSVETENAYVNVLTTGNLSTLRWVESPLKLHKPDDKLCYVYNAAVNSNDLLIANGKMNTDNIPTLNSKDYLVGKEFSGRDLNGKRIMGLVSSKGIATTVLVDPHLLWEVPDTWSLEQAATVPLIYTTAYYALVLRGGLRSGESVLIHSGASGVGQAAINIALHLNCEVFTTVANADEKKFLLKQNPQLKEKQICDSYDIEFEQLVLNGTNGQGVDVVLSSLKGNQFQASIRSLKKYGHFIQLENNEMDTEANIDLTELPKNISIHVILNEIIFDSSNEIKKELQNLVNKGIQSRIIKPIPSQTYNVDEVEQAFKSLESGNDCIKILIKIRDEEKEKRVSKPTKRSIPAIPRSYFHPDKSYIIVGGLGGLGMEIIEWLLSRGARKIVISNRSGVSNGYQAYSLRRWKNLGNEVLITKNNLMTLQGSEELIQQALTLGPVGGIFNFASILRDGFIKNQTKENYLLSAGAKITVTKQLDLASRKLCPVLDYFVVFSSTSSGRGRPGVSNYGYSNSGMERICETRHRDKLPGLSIQWGAIGDVGIMVDTLGVDNDAAFQGFLLQKIRSCLDVLDKMLFSTEPITSSQVLPDKFEGAKADTKQSLINIIGKILEMKDLASTKGSTTLVDLGMDSLMITEIMQTLERLFDISLTVNETQNLTVSKILEIDAKVNEKKK